MAASCLYRRIPFARACLSSSPAREASSRLVERRFNPAVKILLHTRVDFWGLPGHTGPLFVAKVCDLDRNCVVGGEQFAKCCLCFLTTRTGMDFLEGGCSEVRIQDLNSSQIWLSCRIVWPWISSCLAWLKRRTSTQPLCSHLTGFPGCGEGAGHPGFAGR